MWQEPTRIWPRRPEGFVYEPLKTTSSIRVLSLVQEAEAGAGSPRAVGDTVHCSMFEVDLTQNPVYRALSYTWDTSYVKPLARLDREKAIICNGKKLVVGRNLYLALRNLRARLCPTPIWIDAICINQVDEAEKSCQVRMMDRIYSQATLVHVWLGKGFHLLFPATIMRWIEANCDKSLVREGQSREGQSAPALRHMCRVETDEVLRLFSKEENHHKDISFTEHLRDIAVEATLPFLFKLRWFTRVWVLQEAILARELDFSLGDCTVTGNAMFEALERAIEVQRKRLAKHPGGVRVNDDYRHEVLTHLHSVRIMFELRRIRALGPSSDWNHMTSIHYLLLGWNRRAKWVHDKIYGLLGLIGSELSRVDDQTLMAVDYDIPAETIFAIYSWSMLCQDRRLTILSLARGVETRRRPATALSWWEEGSRFVHGLGLPCGLDKVPSWAVDLTCAINPRPLVISHEHSYNAGGDRHDGLQPISLDKSNLTLLLHSHCLDEICAVGEDWSVFQQFGYRYFSGKILTLLSALGHQYKHTGETTLRAAARTLTADHTGYRADAEKTFLRKWGGEGFLNWLVGTVEIALREQADWNRFNEKYEWILKSPIDAQEKVFRRERKSTASAELQSRWDVFLRTVDVDGHVQDTIDTLDHGYHIDSFFLAFRYLYEHRRLFATRAGYLGIGPSSVQVGDAVYIFPGAAMPFVMRNAELDASGCPRRRLVGEAYVHGVMNREAADTTLHPLEELCLV